MDFQSIVVESVLFASGINLIESIVFIVNKSVHSFKQVVGWKRDSASTRSWRSGNLPEIINYILVIYPYIYQKMIPHKKSMRRLTSIYVQEDL